MRVGVLLNHYAPHQVPHVAPFAFALSRLRPAWGVEILCSTAAELDFASEIAAFYPGTAAEVRMLDVPLYARLLDPILSNYKFYRKRAVLRGNATLFATFDALIVPELTSLKLRSQKGLADLKLIYTGHGPGDAYGKRFGALNPRSDEMDLILVQTKRLGETALREGRLRPGRFGLTGCPKFEVVASERPRLFDNDRPTVLYAPTQHREKTSWHRFGEQILEFFGASDRYNLIFAPHVLLFKRSRKWGSREVKGARFPSRFRDSDTLKIDLGSRASIDMTNLRAADIYLGDQSSQIYEFINWPRPCVFLNHAGARWQDNPDYRSWTFGPVVDDLADLDAALTRAVQEFSAFEPIQRAVRDDDRATGEMPPSERGARIVAEFLETGSVSERWLW